MYAHWNGVDSYSRHFGAISKQLNGDQKLHKLECVLLIFIYIYANFIYLQTPYT